MTTAALHTEPAAPQSCAERLHWVDTAKFLGILFIFYGHFAEAGGKAYLFVYEFHVPFFFLLSGFFASSSMQKKLGTYLVKRADQLLLPYLVYSVLTVLVLALHQDWSLPQLVQAGIQIGLGVDYWQQNSCVAVAGRWFLVCLFVVSVVYRVLGQMLRHRLARLAACVVVYFAGTLLLGYDVLHYPRMVWGVDRALCYMLYYSLGECLFPAYKKIPQLAAWKRLALLAAAGAVGVWVFFAGSGSITQMLPTNAPILLAVLRVVLVVVLCSLFVMLAQLLPPQQFILRCGRETLALCSGEQIIRVTLQLFPAVYLVSTPYAVLLSALLMLAVGVYGFTALTRPLLDGVRRTVTDLFAKQ